MMYYGIDSYYLMLVIPAIIISILAQILIKKRYNAYGKVPTKINITGSELVEKMLMDNGISDIKVNSIPGTLTDHYIPKKSIINLSKGVYGSNSIGALGVAAHEVGHAIQYKDEYLPIKIKGAILPVVSVSSKIAPYIIIMGFVFNYTYLIEIGIVLFSATVVFTLLTLPIEINASKRALEYLRSSDVLLDYELEGAKKVLFAAALTYIASALTAIAHLATLLLRRRR